MNKSEPRYIWNSDSVTFSSLRLPPSHDESDTWLKDHWKDAPIPPDLPTVIRRLVDLYGRVYPGLTAEDINHGLCEDFAQDVCRLFPTGKSLWDYQARPYQKLVMNEHCFVVWREKAYDSECPDGVPHWWHLPCFGRVITEYLHTGRELPEFMI
jgi:hypothetical protein